MSIKKVMKELCRYIIVGGSAFIIDFIILYLSENYVFKEFGLPGIYISTALGFLGGLTYNYILSLIYVFDSAKEKNKGHDICSFIIFTVIGIIGLILTELGMYVGVKFLGLNYLLVKVFVAGIVLIWNYGVRKIIIFR